MSNPAAQEAVKLLEQAGAANGNAPPDPISAAEQLVEILDLGSVGLTITGARIVGRGGSASADLNLSDGSTLTFERLRDVGKPGVLAVEVAACTGATPKLNGPQALRAIALLRALAEHEAAFDGDQVAREWGTSFLQEATVVDLDMADQAQRWGAFAELAAIDPVAMRAAGEATSIASACRVLRHENGTRYVRTGWFRAHVRAEESISSTELANRMSRVGWARRGQSGRVKAIRPDLPGELIWTFYSVPEGWESGEAGERE